MTVSFINRIQLGWHSMLAAARRALIYANDGILSGKRATLVRIVEGVELQRNMSGNAYKSAGAAHLKLQDFAYFTHVIGNVPEPDCWANHCFVLMDIAINQTGIATFEKTRNRSLKGLMAICSYKSSLRRFHFLRNSF